MSVLNMLLILLLCIVTGAICLQIPIDQPSDADAGCANIICAENARMPLSTAACLPINGKPAYMSDACVCEACPSHETDLLHSAATAETWKARCLILELKVCPESAKSTTTTIATRGSSGQASAVSATTSFGVDNSGVGVTFIHSQQYQEHRGGKNKDNRQRQIDPRATAVSLVVAGSVCAVIACLFFGVRRILCETSPRRVSTLDGAHVQAQVQVVTRRERRPDSDAPLLDPRADDAASVLHVPMDDNPAAANIGGPMVSSEPVHPIVL